MRTQVSKFGFGAMCSDSHIFIISTPLLNGSRDVVVQWSSALDVSIYSV